MCVHIHINKNIYMIHVYIHIHVYIYINSGVPQKYFHVQGGAMFAYNDELNAASAGPVTPLWRILMHNQCSRNKRTHPEDYRDIPLPTVQEYQAHIAHSQVQSMEIDATEISRE
jgi:hypothetical protein